MCFIQMHVKTSEWRKMNLELASERNVYEISHIASFSSFHSSFLSGFCTSLYFSFPVVFFLLYPKSEGQKVTQMKNHH